MTGFVYIIGAGCGAYDLITLRGLNALKRCDTIIYDALTDPGLLALAPENAELIPVGKRAGKHSAKQEDINALLVEKALAGRTVARLKGGDPFVFGRGGEEISELQKHAVPFALIPGVSSGIAVPELAGIPVTHRKVSRAFHVITSHTADDRQDFSRYAAYDGTLVFLMGLGALAETAEGLIKGGKSPDTPAAVISEGGTVRQRVIRAPLADIAEEAADMPAPAVIVVGETAGFDFSPPRMPTVTVTGTPLLTGKLSALLEAERYAVRRSSHVRIAPAADIPALDGYGCIAFTSSYAARIFGGHLRDKRIDLRTLAGVKFAAVGSGTAQALAEYGIYADIIPASFNAKSLGEAIADTPDIGKVLILRGVQGSEELPRVLSQRGTDFDDIHIYDTVYSGLPPEEVCTDYIIFGSSFGVRAFFDNGSRLSEGVRVVCIGEKTASVVPEYTNSKIIRAVPDTAEGAVNSIKGDIKP